MNAPATFGTWEEAVRWLTAQPDQQALVRASYYDDPLTDAAARYWQSEEWAAVRGLLPASRGRALDVGAGRGIASFALAKDGFQVTALEPDGSALVGAQAIRSLAKASGLSIEVTQEFSERLPFEDKQFDVVFARAVLHHTSDLAAACREFLRVLKPGGVLVAVREHVISRPEDLPAFFDIHPLHKLYGGENALQLSEYRTAITAAGFNIRSILSPLESPINYAPQTLLSLQGEVAKRLTRHLPYGLGSSLAKALLETPLIWAIARRVLTVADRRPGRLYSFVCTRPS